VSPARFAPDRRVLFVVLALLVVVPLLAPPGLPLVVSAPTRAYHDAIDRVPRGAIVLVACDFDPATTAELAPMARATFRRLLSRGVRVVTVSLWSGGGPLADRLLREAAATVPGARDGIDYVNLGYQAGNEAVMARLAGGIAAAFPADHAGRPSRDLPIVAQARTWSDVALLVSLSAGWPGTREWLQQVQARTALPVVAGVTAAAAPELTPYLDSGQLRGLLGGMSGAAEYEQLLGGRGPAARGMDAQSLAHAFVALCVVLGGVAGRRPRGEAA
jgi:hypothetical protein